MMCSRRRNPRRALAVVLVLAAAAACGGGDAGGDDAVAASTTTTPATSTSTSTTTTTSSTTTTTEPADPWAVPDEIDEPYVERVLTKLYAIQGRATRIAVKEGLVPQRAVALLQTAFSDRVAAAYANALSNEALDGFPSYRSSPGNPAVAIDELIEQRASCLAARGELDFSPASIDSLDPVKTSFRLGKDDSGRNPTGWILDLLEVDEGAPKGITCE
jgi:hypothetical protein